MRIRWRKDARTMQTARKRSPMEIARSRKLTKPKPKPKDDKSGHCLICFESPSAVATKQYQRFLKNVRKSSPSSPLSPSSPKGVGHMTLRSKSASATATGPTRPPLLHCDHVYCRPCLSKYVRNSIYDGKTNKGKYPAWTLIATWLPLLLPSSFYTYRFLAMPFACLSYPSQWWSNQVSSQSQRL